MIRVVGTTPDSDKPLADTFALEMVEPVPTDGTLTADLGTLALVADACELRARTLGFRSAEGRQLAAVVAAIRKLVPRVIVEEVAEFHANGKVVE